MNESFKMYDDVSDTCKILDMFSVLTTLKQKSNAYCCAYSITYKTSAYRLM